MNPVLEKTEGPAARSQPAAAPQPTPDPRESADAFLALPSDVKEFVIDGWRESDAHDERVRRGMQAERKLAMLHALALLAPAHLFLRGLTGMNILGAVALAALVGSAWSRLRTGQVATPMIAAVAFSLFELVWLFGDPTNFLALLFATAFIAYCSAYLGLRREMRIME